MLAIMRQPVDPYQTYPRRPGRRSASQFAETDAVDISDDAYAYLAALRRGDDPSCLRRKPFDKNHGITLENR
jgi:hypothetical protein